MASHPGEDPQVLAYARAWAPFGGPPGTELFVLFGMAPQRFYDLVRRMILGSSSTGTRCELDRRLLILAAGYEHRGASRKLTRHR